MQFIKTFFCRQTLAWGAIQSALAVMLGAFAAHGLKQKLSTYHLDIFQTAVQYHVTHAIALLFYGLWLGQEGRPYSKSYGVQILFQSGILLFSGSLYTLALTDLRFLGMITPFGGLSFITAWLLFARQAWSKPST